MALLLEIFHAKCGEASYRGAEPSMAKYGSQGAQMSADET